MNRLLLAALGAAGRGWPVFPLAPGSKRPALHGERACPGTGPCTGGHLGWEQRATTDPDRIRGCWGHDAYNVGLATGPAGLVVLDLDRPKHDAQPPEEWALPGLVDGHDVLAALAEQVGEPLPQDTYTVATPSGGTHLYYRHPDTGSALRNTTGTLGWLIDTRAHGGYVVAAGSTAEAGTYELVHDVPPAPLPDWLVEKLAPRPVDLDTEPATRLGDPERRRLTPLLRTVLEAREGERNSRLYWAALRLFAHAAGGQVDARAGADALLDAATHVGLPDAEARATIASAYRHHDTTGAAA